MMDFTREEVGKIVDFLRENPEVAKEFGVVVNGGIVERIDSLGAVVERHFEESSSRFAVLDGKFNALVKEMHDGFEEARKQREAGFAAANRRFEEHDRKFDAVIKEMHDGFEEARKQREAGFAAVNKQIGSIGSTLGRLIEDRVSDKTEAYVERAGWTVSRRVVAGGEEIDFLVKDGVRFLVEVKSHADMASLDQVVRKSKKLKIKGILVGERVDRGVAREAVRRKIMCIPLSDLGKWLKRGGAEKFYSK